MIPENPSRPDGRPARVLLTSVFGPYARDDSYGSRVINPMELYHNQVTREQGAFSLRMFHRSWGIMMIQCNIDAPSTVLDFPTRERFAQEITRHRYDLIGISSIIVNVGKVREMCRMARELSPHSEIAVGGHVTAIPGIEQTIDADHFVRGDGIAWMRRHLGENPDAPVRHPDVLASFGLRVMGVSIRTQPDSVSATLIPSVGCPIGCNFCTTSSFFGGKGRFLNFFETGKELFDVMSGLERKLGVRSFFVMDENFLLHRRRAMDLLACMKAAGKEWSLYVFSSANAIRKYTMRELVELGVSWIWMGLESPRSQYQKLEGTDTVKLARTLHEHGIKLLGSTIIGLEHHTPDDLPGEIDHAISHGADFHQFMLYTPVPGTPLYREVAGQGRLLDVDLADIHGQFKFNFRHPAISRDESKRLLDWAFQRDMEFNGPSLYRICRTTLAGWRRYRNDPDPRVRRRFAGEARGLGVVYGPVLWAMERRLRKSNPHVARQVRALRLELENEFGLLTRAAARLLGAPLVWTAWREEKRLARGWTYEPPTFLERRNWSA